MEKQGVAPSMELLNDAVIVFAENGSVDEALPLVRTLLAPTQTVPHAHVETILKVCNAYHELLRMRLRRAAETTCF